MSAAVNESLISIVVDIPGHVESRSTRSYEPVTCAVPLSRAAVKDASFFLVTGDGQRVATQSTVLERWVDGSIKWLLLDWQAHGIEGTQASYILEAGEPTARSSTGLTIERHPHGVTVDSGATTFAIQTGAQFLFVSVKDPSGQVLLQSSPLVLRCRKAEGAAEPIQIHDVTVERAGAFRAIVNARGVVGDGWLEVDCRTHFYAGSPVATFELTLRNPKRAAHRGGLWTLGDGGSVFLKEASVAIPLPAPGSSSVSFSPEIDRPLAPVSGEALEIYQDSSGGERWNGSIHVNRNGVVPHTFRGYRAQTHTGVETGLRATPIVLCRSGETTIGIAVKEFWQNFPKAITVSSHALELGLFPRQSSDVHELQGGEQKTHVFAVAFGPDRVTDFPLDWVRRPSVARCTPEWYSASGAVPYITPWDNDPNTTYLSLCHAALEGPDTFEKKREVIDEYGWRHFGDVYGDHEAIHDPGRLVSHYNNQYDPIAGFAYQFMRSGDVRWWHNMAQLARHVVDIDIYHTDQDKAAYNHGLFWHTVHYIDASTSTHRSYPRAPGSPGGGPASEHNYTSGLLLYYLLTGAEWSKAAAVGLGQFVIDRDDPHATPLWVIDRGYTGLSSASGSPGYHGPGRGSGNSLNALIDAHRLTADRRFLDKADQIIRRCVHPREDIERHQLLDAERRWFYTMMLEAMGKYLDAKAERGDIDDMYAYTQASLLHYARWMGDHEEPYLHHPEKLEFPTETWAAQDMRKSDIFKFAARHAEGEERTRFLERSEFFFRYSTETLAAMATRTLARPVIVLLTHGFMHAWFERNAATLALPKVAAREFGEPETFVPQMARAVRRLKAGAAVVAAATLAVLVWWLS